VNAYKHLPMAVALALVLASFAPTKEKAAPVTGAVATALANASRADKSRLGRFYEAVADVTSRDKGVVIKTTAEWRARHSQAAQLEFGSTGFVGKYAGLDRAVDSIVFAALGDKVRPMTDEVGGKPIWMLVSEACDDVRRQCE